MLDEYTGGLPLPFTGIASLAMKNEVLRTDVLHVHILVWENAHYQYIHLLHTPIRELLSENEPVILYRFGQTKAVLLYILSVL